MINSTLPKIRHNNTTIFPAGSCLKTSIHSHLTDQENAPIDLNTVYLYKKEDNNPIHDHLERWMEDLKKDSSLTSFDRILKEYKRMFHDGKYGSRLFDVHARPFQNFVLQLTNRMNREQIRELSLSHDHSDKRLLRTRVYAISSRVDVGWNGETNLSHEQQEEKKNDLIDHLESLTMYDWYAPNHKDSLVGNKQEIPLNISDSKKRKWQQIVTVLHCWVLLVN